MGGPMRERGHRRLPRGVREARPNPGEIVLQAGFNLTADEESAVASSRKWKATQLEESYRSELQTRPRCSREGR